MTVKSSKEKRASKSTLAFASVDSNLVTASDSMKQILSSNLASFECRACDSHMTASADANPFCIHCGSDQVDLSDSPEVNPEVKNLKEDDVAAIECSSCNSFNIFSLKALTAASHIHCSCCGEKLSIKSNAAGELEEVDPPMTLDDSDEIQADDQGSDLSNPETLFEDDSEDVSLDEMLSGEDDQDMMADSLDEDDFSDNGEVESHSEMEMPDEPMQMGLESEPTDMEEPAITDTGMPDFLRDAQPPSQEDENFAEDQIDVIPDEMSGDPLMDALELDDTNVGFDTMYSAGRIVAMKGHVAVASLTRKVAGANADIMTSAGFRKAVANSVAKYGMRKGLKAMAFQPIRVATLSKASVARQVQMATASTATKAASEMKTFSDSLALASAGFSRSKWKGYENPLRASFEQELARAGIRNPKRIAATIFQSHSVAYAKNLVEIANKLSKMSAASRAELADMLDMTEDDLSTEDQTSNNTDDGSHDNYLEDDSDVSLEARLNTTAALLRPSSKSSPVTANVFSEAQSILDGKSPLNFNF